METNRLKQFCVVYETKNLRKASELLHMSHSALSKSLKVLQVELNLELLQQQGRGIVITELGQDFYHKVKTFLNYEKQLLLNLKPDNEIFKIGSFESFSTHLIGMRWKNYFGHQSVQVKELSSGLLEQAVYDKNLNAAITYEPVPHKDLDFIYLGKVTMGAYVRKGTFKNIEFSEIPFVAPLLPSVGVPSNAKGLDGWPEHEYARNILYQVDLMETGLSIVRSGLAAIFIPDFVAKAQNEALAEDYKLISRPLPKNINKIERRVFLIVRQGNRKEKNIVKLIEMIKKECIE